MANDETSDGDEEWAGADVSMTAWMRLILAIAAYMTAFVDSGTRLKPFLDMEWGVLSAYAIYAFCLYMLARREGAWQLMRTMCYLDVSWFALIVYYSGGGQSFFFPIFLFAILTASFRWGFDEGARVTLFSSGLFFLISMSTSGEYIQLLWRTTLLLALGYMAAYWGGSEVTQKRRLSLLRNVAQVANPRFGVDQTLSRILETTRDFFHASDCVLLMSNRERTAWTVRKVGHYRNGHRSVDEISATLADRLMTEELGEIAIYNRARFPLLLGFRKTRDTHCRIAHRWHRQVNADAALIADLLEARAFVAVLLPLRNGSGRFFVLSQGRSFSRNDGLCLNDIASQAFPTIETIDVLDQLASRAAVSERERIAHDLHDSAIQPYIGLKQGLAAMRLKATRDNPLCEDIDRLSDMAAEVIGGLRRFTGTLAKESHMPESEVLHALRRQVAQLRQFYGIDIELRVAENELHLNDRLGAEIFQIVNEGLSNIRRHTAARQGWISIERKQASLYICICNEQYPEIDATSTPAAFTPGSITRRTEALGGRVVVKRTAGETRVLVAIPV